MHRAGPSFLTHCRARTFEASALRVLFLAVMLIASAPAPLFAAIAQGADGEGDGLWRRAPLCLSSPQSQQGGAPSSCPGHCYLSAGMGLAPSEGAVSSAPAEAEARRVASLVERVAAIPRFSCSLSLPRAPPFGA